MNRKKNRCNSGDKALQKNGNKDKPKCKQKKKKIDNSRSRITSRQTVKI